MHLILHESNRWYESFLSHYYILLLLISLVYLLPNGQWLFRVLLLIDPKLPALMMLLLWLLLRPDELARRRKSFSVGDVSTELGTANTSRLVGLVCRFSIRFIIFIINENRSKYKSSSLLTDNWHLIVQGPLTCRRTQKRRFHIGRCRQLHGTRSAGSHMTPDRMFLNAFLQCRIPLTGFG